MSFGKSLPSCLSPVQCRSSSLISHSPEQPHLSSAHDDEFPILTPVLYAQNTSQNQFQRAIMSGSTSHQSPGANGVSRSHPEDTTIQNPSVFLVDEMGTAGSEPDPFTPAISSPLRDVDPQIIEALRGKDRIYVLKLGELMESLINDERR